jgi:hypothetical protein
MFSEEEWAAPDDEASWVPFEHWKDARRSYSKQHPDSELGSVLVRFDVLLAVARWRPRDGEAS